MQRILVILVLALGIMGCDGEDDAGTSPSWKAEFPYSPYNAVTGESPQYQATQILTPPSQQQVTSRRYVMTVSMF